MAMTASLPMYDLPELRPAAESVWRSMAGALRATGVQGVPVSLSWAPPRELWRDRALLFSQTCGYPLINGFAGRLRPVATPCYRAEGCDGPRYRSAVVVRRSAGFESLEDCRGAVCAVNSWDSLSGWQALAARVAPLARQCRFFGAARLTGSHLASADAVVTGEADVAAIDAICWSHFRRFRPAMAQALRVLTWTDPAPGLPFVTLADAEDYLVARLRRAIMAMLADPAVDRDRETLLLADAEILEIGDYAVIRDIAGRAAALGQPEALAA